MSDNLLITFAILAYNQERYIQEAIEGALSQTYSPLEIIFSDDCSSDRTFEIIKKNAEAYKGPHKVIVNHNGKNLGIGGHINKVMALSNGKIIVGAAADDISEPERVQNICDAYEFSGKRCKSIHSSCKVINDDGRYLGLAQIYENFSIDIEEIIRGGTTHIYGCTHAWDREVFDKYGELPQEIQNEDEVIPFRSLLIGEVAYIQKPLVRYRLHGNNMSGIPLMTGKVIKNKKELYNYYNRRYFRDLNISKCHLADLKKNVDILDPARKEKIIKLLEDKIFNANLEVKLRNGNLVEKIRIIRESAKENKKPVNILKYIFRLLFPELYKEIQYHNYMKHGKQLIINTWED